MKTSILALAFLMLLAGTAFARDVYVNGYTKNDGTRVESYNRTSPNNTRNDNWSTKGNTNPYTGQQGTKSPDPYGSGYNNRYGNQNQNNRYGN